MNRQGTQFST